MMIEPIAMADWDRRVQRDLKARISKYDNRWARNYELVRNSGEGRRSGNLVSEFIRTLHTRLLAVDPQIAIEPDDPDYVDKADNASIVCQAVARVAKLRIAMQEAVTNATWASQGWLEIGHPMDPLSNDVMRKATSPNVNASVAVGDEYIPATEDELKMRGISPDDVDPFAPLEEMPLDDEPQPIFNPAFGYPWVQSVDPRMIVTNLNAKNRDQMDYICRLRFLTKAEIKKITGKDLMKKNLPSSREYEQLFEQTEGEPISSFPQMMLIAELWIIRDRNNPQYNNYYVSYILGDPSEVLVCKVAPYGGAIPLEPIKLSKLKKMYDVTLAEELAPFADIYHKGVKSLTRSMERMLNRKTAVGAGAGLDPKDEKHLNDDNYNGTVKVSDVNAVKQLLPETFDANLLQMMSWTKSVAQSTTGASDLDRGTAIKDISARQTQALLDSTGINVEGMKDPVNESYSNTIIKIMHFVGMFNGARARKYSYGNRIASMDVGTHDFTSSYLYEVEVRDNEEQVSNEERLVWIQFIRTLFSDSGGQLVPFFDLEALAKTLVRRFSASPGLLAAKKPFDPTQVEPPLSEGDPNISGQPGIPGNMGNAAEGQHPERQMGDRGVSLQNALTGMLKTGTGMGEG